MSSEPPQPASMEDNHADTNARQAEAENDESQGTSQLLQQNADTGTVIEQEPVRKNLIKKIHSRARAYTAKKKASIADWRRDATPEHKNLVVNTSLAMFTGVMTFLTFVLATEKGLSLPFQLPLSYVHAFEGVDQSVIKATTDGRRKVYIFGVLEYEDALTKGMSTRFCFKFGPKNTDMALCSTWNGQQRQQKK